MLVGCFAYSMVELDYYYRGPESVMLGWSAVRVAFDQNSVRSVDPSIAIRIPSYAYTRRTNAGLAHPADPASHGCLHSALQVDERRFRCRY